MGRGSVWVWGSAFAHEMQYNRHSHSTSPQFGLSRLLSVGPEFGLANTNWA